MENLQQKSLSHEEVMNQMQKAFDEFHAAISRLQKEQQDVISAIQKRIDQKKIEDIHTLLQQSQQ